MISSFKDEFSFLSNFFEAPIVFRNLDFRNSEAAYQACKMWGCVNTSQFCSMTGSQAKKAGKLIPTEQMDPDWDKNRLSVMSEIIHCKFLQNKDLRLLLVQTGTEELVEGNYWGDTFWGICNGEGTNWLGILLMAERAYWQKVSELQA